MTNEQASTMVFKDQAGEYYLIPLETLQRGRVPAEHKAELEQLISEPDVSGHSIVVGAIATVGGFLILDGVSMILSGGKQPTAADVKNSWIGRQLGL